MMRPARERAEMEVMRRRLVGAAILGIAIVGFWLLRASGVM